MPFFALWITPPGFFEVRSDPEGALLGWLPAVRVRPDTGAVSFIVAADWRQDVAAILRHEAPSVITRQLVSLRLDEFEQRPLSNPKLVVARYVYVATLADYLQLQRVTAFVDAE